MHRPRSPALPFETDQSDRARFWRWVDDDTPPTAALSSLVSTLDHLQSFWAVRQADNIVLLHYQDLTFDLEGQMRTVADRLEIDVPEPRWPSLVKAASLDEMRARPAMTAPDVDSSVLLDEAAFFRKGRIGAWREIVDSEQDLRRYDERVARLAPPDLSEWAHRS